MGLVAGSGCRVVRFGSPARWAGSGEVWHCLGKARLGGARHGIGVWEWLQGRSIRPPGTHGNAGLGMAWCGALRLAEVRRCSARQGVA